MKPRLRNPGAHDLTPIPPSGLLHATPVVGTAVPPRASSGAVRRLAYLVPEHRASRWMLLLMGDKLDLDHRLSTGLWLLPAAAALVVGDATVSRAVRR